MKLTDSEKRLIDEMPTIGYWSALGGVEVKKVEHGIEDYFICRVGSWRKKPTYHRVKVNYTPAKYVKSRPFIVIHFEKLFLNDLILSLM
jgi:hypothetical protein